METTNLKQRRRFKDKFADNFALGILSILFIGFLAGMGTYKAIIVLTKPEISSIQNIDIVKEQTENTDTITTLYNNAVQKNDSLINEINLIRSSLNENENKVTMPATMTYGKKADTATIAANNPSIDNIGGRKQNAVSQKTIIANAVQLPPTPDIKLNLGHDTTLCEGSSLILNANMPDASYLWQNGSTDPTISVSKDGLYWVRVFRGNASKSDTVSVKFLAPPKPKLTDTTLCNGKELLIDATTEDASYAWNDNSTDPFLKIKDAGNYWVKVSNHCGSITDSIKISYKECNCSVRIPKAFTPDHDTFSDQFSPVFDCDYLDKYDLKIFSQWGELLFATHDKNTAWDGSYKGNISPNGTYIWVMNYGANENGKILNESKLGTVGLFK